MRVEGGLQSAGAPTRGLLGVQLRIVQVVRRMDPHGGVGGVACALDEAFRARGVAGPPITLGSLGRLRRRGGRLSATLEILDFSWRASLAARRARRSGAVVLVHGDALGGDIFVDHGLHKALLARRPWLLFNPLHLFIAMREELRHLLCRRTLTLALSPAGLEALRRAYPLARLGGARVAANGVDLRRFRPDPDHLARPNAPGRLDLAFVGHEFGRKGLRHLLDAMALLPDGVRLEVVGGRPREVRRARARAERLGVCGRVAFLGVRTDVETVLRRAHLLVLPSCQEAFPLVALEAMACGAGVLLSGVPAASELVGGAEEAGRSVARSGPAIAGVLQALAADPEQVSRMRLHAVARAQAFGWPSVAQGYIALAEEVRRGRGVGDA
jgi:glycosyltransferase involved in cell wall biosynthesis